MVNKDRGYVMINNLKAVSHSLSHLLSGRRKERRRHGRRSEHLQGRNLVVEFVGGVRTVPIVDSHHGGLGIASPTKLPVGALVTFRGAPDTRAQRFAKIRGRATVAYCRAYGRRRFLVGLRFNDVYFSSQWDAASMKAWRFSDDDIDSVWNDSPILIVQQSRPEERETPHRSPLGPNRHAL